MTFLKRLALATLLGVSVWSISGCSRNEQAAEPSTDCAAAIPRKGTDLPPRPDLAPAPALPFPEYVSVERLGMPQREPERVEVAGEVDAGPSKLARLKEEVSAAQVESNKASEDAIEARKKAKDAEEKYQKLEADWLQKTSTTVYIDHGYGLPEEYVKGIEIAPGAGLIEPVTVHPPVVSGPWAQKAARELLAAKKDVKELDAKALEAERKAVDAYRKLLAATNALRDAEAGK
jgi:hypothetical protein